MKEKGEKKRKEMKKIKKLALALAIVFSICTVASTLQMATPFTEQVEAKTKSESVQFFKGQKIGYEALLGKFSKVTSSNSKIVKVTGKTSTKFYLVGKKPGKATVTVKFKGGQTNKIYVTIGDPKKVKVSYVSRSVTNHRVFFKITNKSGIDLSSATVKYILRDNTGKEQSSGRIYDNDYLLNGKSSIYGVYYYGNDPAPVLSKSTVTIEKLIPETHKTVKLKKNKHYTYSTKRTSSGVKVNLKNKIKKSIICRVDVKFYKNGELIEAKSTYAYVSAKKKYSVDVSCYGSGVDKTSVTVTSFYKVY